MKEDKRVRIKTWFGCIEAPANLRVATVADFCKGTKEPWRRLRWNPKNRGLELV